jgi:hypothetical protein
MTVVQHLTLERLRKLIPVATAAETGREKRMTKRRRLLRAAEIKGFLIGYEKGGGQTFAFGHCPHCGETFETFQVKLDAGPPTAEKISAHIVAKHNPKEDAAGGTT